MERYIPKSALVAEIERQQRRLYALSQSDEVELRKSAAIQNGVYCNLRSLLDTLETKEVDSESNGWIDCRKQMPPETKYTSDTLQGRKGWTKSDPVLAWDSMYGCRVDATKNGKWMSEQGSGYTGQVVHGIIAWRPIPKFDEELLIKA